MFKKDLNASRNIHKLANFISLFRQRILKYIETEYEKSFNNWSEMKDSNIDDYYIKEAVVKCGLSLKDWERIKLLYE